jgi:hypothetical protein
MSANPWSVCSVQETKEITMRVKSTVLIGMSLVALMTMGLASASAHPHARKAQNDGPKRSRVRTGNSLEVKRFGHRRVQRKSSRFGALRQADQLMRIRDGLRSGTLTRREARTLFRLQRRITRSRKFYLRDGNLSRFERRKLRRLLNRADRYISRLSRNAFFNHRHRIRPRRPQRLKKRVFRTTVFS